VLIRVPKNFLMRPLPLLSEGGTMIIDAHAHLWVEDWVPAPFWDGMAKRVCTVRKKTRGEELTIETVKKTLFPAYWDKDGSVLIAEMDHAGIDKTVIHPLDLGIELGEAKASVEEINESYAAAARRYPGRIIAYAGVDPRRKNAVEILERGVKSLGMKGLKLDPAAGYYPNDKICYSLYKKAQDLGVPVLFHTGATIPPFRNKYTQPIYLDDVSLDFPELTLIAAHMGFGWWQELASMMAKRTNLITDISGWQQNAIRHFPTFVRTLREMMHLVGADNMLFGTDGPSFRLYNLQNRDWAEMIRNLPREAPEGLTFQEAEIELLLGKSAQVHLKL
jgi:predicted TIM-barrel fold metal-dependent hydrolase